ncbi:NADP-specific glutamate dehydrogenase [bacterium]|nr:NADP-specific glutamate dehydrogenase [bacterium]|tara:strand:+ start:2219 stop:3571 length:1353 start_codon:yes stop_codon:yes gene_type:complete
MTTKTDVKRISVFMEKLIDRHPGENEFHQAVQEVVESVYEFVENNPKYKEANILERIVEPDRIVIFRVTWETDNNKIQVNRGYRVQFNNAIGPYKGGLRFHPSVTLGTFKFLGFEQIFKNSLTTLPMGGAKGGSDFDPKGKSDREIMRFCQAFMLELHRHIGSNIDIPAGDIGVGSREIAYLFGMYKKIQNNFTGTITGKQLNMGGSLIRTEATGYGCVYFAQEMLQHIGEDIREKICVISGSGNVAQYTAEKIIELGGKVVSFSDSGGSIYDEAGVTEEKLNFVKDLKNNKHGRIKEYAEKYKVPYYENQSPWHIKCNLAFPSATQNELTLMDAKELIKNGCILVAEGSNMGSTPEAIHYFKETKTLFGVSKAANAGGVAVSGLEMAQNRMGYSWTREDLDERLKNIMKKIHQQCLEYGQSTGYVDYVKGANIAGFKKVADTILAYGTH